MKWLTFLGVILIIIHGFWPNFFIVDTITVLLFFILLLPSVAPYLKRAKIPGVEFEFKEEIQETRKVVQRSVEKAKENERTGKAKILPFETFKLSAVKKLLESEDFVLALAALRIEIERKLRLAANFLRLDDKDKMPIFKIVGAMGDRGMLDSDQMVALRRIVIMCNKAIHGSFISKEEAEQIIDLAEKLNLSFPVGCSINFSSNSDYKKHSLFCEWEHCIEWMPLTEKPTQKSCPCFGHNCPGGFLKIKECGKKFKDFPRERFIK